MQVQEVDTNISNVQQWNVTKLKRVLCNRKVQFVQGIRGESKSNLLENFGENCKVVQNSLELTVEGLINTLKHEHVLRAT